MSGPSPRHERRLRESSLLHEIIGGAPRWRWKADGKWLMANGKRSTTMTNAPRISVFPKCYFDELVAGRMNYVEWIHDAATLGGEGVEHYDEFFPSLAAGDVDAGARCHAGNRSDHVDALLLAQLHTPGSR